MDGSSRNIILLLFQYSVVMKGIERTLNEAGYYVETLDNFEQIPYRVDRTDLFIAYLPTDIVDDKKKTESLDRICTLIKESDGRLLLIGEKKYNRELTEAVPAIEDYIWLDRPVEIDVLKPAIEKAIAGEKKEKPKKRILIVDDDPAYAGMVREWIMSEYHVDIVTSGSKAIKFLGRHTVDMILLDYEMPDLDGPQVLQVLNQKLATKIIPVIFLTGVGTKEAVQRVMSLKPDGYVLKSTTKEDLIKYLHGKLT